MASSGYLYHYPSDPAISSFVKIDNKLFYVIDCLQLLLETAQWTCTDQLSRVCDPMTMISEWRVSTIDSRSTHSAQLYCACARLACAGPSCYYRSSVQTLDAEKELWDMISKQSTNQSVCLNRIPYSTQLHPDCTGPKRYCSQELWVYSYNDEHGKPFAYNLLTIITKLLKRFRDK